jgi:hypothetical protein
MKTIILTIALSIISLISFSQDDMTFYATSLSSPDYPGTEVDTDNAFIFSFSTQELTMVSDSYTDGEVTVDILHLGTLEGGWIAVLCDHDISLAIHVSNREIIYKMGDITFFYKGFFVPQD